MFGRFSGKYSQVRVSKEEPVIPTQAPVQTPVKAKSMYAAQTHKADDELWQEWCVGQMPIHHKTHEPKKMLECLSPSSDEEQNTMYEWCTGMRLSSESRETRMSFSSCDSNY